MFDLFSVDPQGNQTEVKGMPEARGFLLREHNDDGTHAPVAGNFDVGGYLGAPNQPKIILRLSGNLTVNAGNQAIPSWADPLASTPYGITTGDGGFHVGPMWDAANPTFIKIPVTGLYFVSYQITWAGNASTAGPRTTAIQPGGPAEIMRHRIGAGDGVNDVVNSCAAVYPFVAGQAMYMSCTNGSVANINIRGAAGSSLTWWQVLKIG